MRFNMLFFLLIVSCLGLAFSQMTYDDCCLRYVKPISSKAHKYVVSYRLQETDGGCNIAAVIFTMKRGRVFCTDPRETWVVKLMNKIDTKKGKNISHRSIRG